MIELITFAAWYTWVHKVMSIFKEHSLVEKSPTSCSSICNYSCICCGCFVSFGDYSSTESMLEVQSIQVFTDVFIFYGFFNAFYNWICFFSSAFCLSACWMMYPRLMNFQSFFGMIFHSGKSDILFEKNVSKSDALYELQRDIFTFIPSWKE